VQRGGGYDAVRAQDGVLLSELDWETLAFELMTIVVLRKAPPLPTLPEALHGRPVLVVVPCYVGSLEEGARWPAWGRARRRCAGPTGGRATSACGR
jgi:hypothetical protein